ncbi:MAG TPA: DUF3147 family protein [Burkholderiaceae bacterium]|jgi:membrane protein YqaA with SNARE-associated domain
MLQYIAKIIVSAILIAVVSELAKRNSIWAATLASLPLISLLAFIWLYIETGDANRIATLAQGIFWLVLPSLVLFILLPILLRAGWNFWPSLLASCIATAGAYAAMAWLLSRFGVRV